MRKRLLLTVGIIGLFLLSGCQVKDRRAGVKTPFGDGVEEWGKKLPYKQWQFVFFYPAHMPAVVTLAVVEDGNVAVTTYRRPDTPRESRHSIGKWSSTVGNFLAVYNTGTALPVSMHFCWDSVIDRKPYETLIWFDRETWQQMTAPYPVRFGTEKEYWRSDMIIGLAPGGVVRVWLSNQDEPAVLQSKARISTVSGDDRLMCKGITQHPYGYVYYGETPEFIKGKTYPYGEW